MWQPHQNQTVKHPNQETNPRERKTKSTNVSLLERETTKNPPRKNPPFRHKPDRSDASTVKKLMSTVVVGVRLDEKSKELLTWALVKVAEAGDRVVAVHVLPKSSLFSDDSPSSMLSVVRDFDSVLAVYQGFCNLKQIDLKLKICKGLSVRKVLVREAKGFGATKVLLGVGRSNGGGDSLARHCTRKLPPWCWVAAVSCGKIVFQRVTKELGNSKQKNLGSLNGHSADSSLLLFNKGGTEISGFKDGKLPSSFESVRTSCSVCLVADAARDSVLDEKSFNLVTAEDSAPSPSATPPRALSPQARRSWRLVRKMMPHTNGTGSNENSKASIAQWATRRPTQYSASSAIYPKRKTSKLDKNSASSESGSSSWEKYIEIGDEETTPLPKELESLCEKYASTCRLFTYIELASATGNFSEDNLVGKGGNSLVYKGQLPDGKQVAVKILKPSEDLLKEFVLEIEIITSLCHSNILSLIGFGFANVKLLLVYDFWKRGSLEYNLHDVKGNRNSLGWSDRYKIAIGVAEALDYLHNSGNGQPVIHRDVKSSNILLSDDLNPLLSDFGFATWASPSLANVSCRDVAGTFGYMAPEYFIFGKVNEKIDVYAFGVVLLELLSGRKPISEDPNDQRSLVIWARPILQCGKSKQLLDPRFGSRYDDSQLERMIIAASLCIRSSPKLRPGMSLVLKLLRGDDDAMKWARSQLSTIEEIEEVGEVGGSSSFSEIQSHISLAFLDVEDEIFSSSSASYSVDYLTAQSSMESYLQERWSQSLTVD